MHKVIHIDLIWFDRYFQVIKNDKDYDKKSFIFNCFHVGLIFLDNIHFQYNSMMYGLMIFSIAYIQEVSPYLSYLNIEKLC